MHYIGYKPKECAFLPQLFDGKTRINENNVGWKKVTTCSGYQLKRSDAIKHYETDSKGKDQAERLDQ